ncbi:YceH family protein [bacterium]|nr:YceH family protein [bacterium]
MELELTPEEVRVLGALIEKERTTPEYYPLSLNALTNACNQKSNREPVVAYSEDTVSVTIESLRQKELALLVTGAGSRVPKYKHVFGSRFQFNDAEIAILCILMLRGPQTVGEIRSRASRMYAFADLGEVTDHLDRLQNLENGPFVTQLPRQPGRKELRYTHLFSGAPKYTETTVTQDPAAVGRNNEAGNNRISKLEEEVAALQSELQRFKNEFLEFKKQFE